MARARNIKPSIMDNEVLGTADPLYTLLFERLWMLADREGRLEDRPARIRAQAFPHRPEMRIDEALDWLCENNFITRYEVEGVKCIAIDKFLEHQRPHKNEVASVLPSIPAKSQKRKRVLPRYEASTTKAVHNGHSEQCQKQEKSVCLPDTLLSDTLLSDSGFSDSLIPDPGLIKPPNPPSGGVGFDAFWNAYPKKAARPAALKAWNKLKPSETLQAIILADVQDRSNSDAWTKDLGQFIPHASTYLAGRRWEDAKLPSASAKQRDAFQEFIRRGDTK